MMQRASCKRLRSIEVPNDGGVSHYSASNGYIYDDELTDGPRSCSDDEDAVQKNEEQQREQGNKA